MKILYICYNNPFGTSGGGAMASHAYLRACCDIANGNLDLICSAALKGKYNNSMNIKKILYAPDRSIFQKVLSPFTGYMNRYVYYAKKYILQNKSEYDIAVFDHSCIGGTLVKFVNKLGIKTITIHHNHEKEFFSDNYHGLYKLIFLPHVIRWEKLSYCNSSLNLFLTKQDMDTFSKVYGSIRGRNHLLGTFEYNDYEEIQTHSSNSSKETLTFAITGSLGDYQTIDAIKYFFKDLYPHLPSKSKIILAGRNPDKEVVSLCEAHNNAMLISNPENMNDVLSIADIYLCATRIGGGLKLRVMDGLKNGLPVITHTCSSRGFDAFYGLDVFKVFSNPEEFKLAVNTIVDGLKQGKYERTMVKNIYKDIFSYPAGLNRMREILQISQII